MIAVIHVRRIHWNCSTKPHRRRCSKCANTRTRPVLDIGLLQPVRQTALGDPEVLRGPSRSTTSSRNSCGYGSGMVNILPARKSSQVRCQPKLGQSRLTLQNGSWSPSEGHTQARAHVAALTASLAGSISSRITHPQNRGPGTSETAYFSSLLAVEVAGHHVGDRREHRLVL